jgi:PKD repeat protein
MTEPLLKDPSVLKKRNELEAFTQAFLKTPKKKSGANVFVIPIVFHIIHNYGSENVPDSRIYNALRIINEDFRAQNSDTSDVVSKFKGIVGDAEIEFRLAHLDPSGNPTNGITRTVGKETFDAGENVKGLINWNTGNTQNYVQIWVVDNISSGAGGYSFYPGNVGNANEGVVIRNSQIEDRSLTHEIGHYLNLRHTWGDSNTPGDPANCGDDDLVNDTPNTIGNTSCNLNASSCGSPLDNVQNYMEYAFCGRMFTRGQASRMQAALFSSIGTRDNLWSDPNLAQTGTEDGFNHVDGKPQADFYATNKLICQGGNIQFNDASWNADSMTYSWSFPGGTPSTSSDRNPVITYLTSGLFDATLTVSNAQGTSSKTLTKIIQVIDTASSLAPYAESFESITFPNNDWTIVNTEGPGWALTSSTGYTGSKSMKLNNYAIMQGGELDVIYSPLYDFTNVINPRLYYRVAYARKTTSNKDALKVYVSLDCGKTWLLRSNKSGSSLSTVSAPVMNPFTPSGTSQWRRDSISTLQMVKGLNGIRFKFEFVADGGNNIYLDDIYAGGIMSTTGINETAEIDIFDVNPNPAHESATLHYFLQASGRVTMELQDVSGRIVKMVEDRMLPQGNHQAEIDCQGIAPGIYFVRVSSAGHASVRKLVIR